VAFVVLSDYQRLVVVSFDAKINFDDNAAFRQKDIFAMRDPAEEVCWDSIVPVILESYAHDPLYSALFAIHLLTGSARGRG
jgi:hypothetical protein